MPSGAYGFRKLVMRSLAELLVRRTSSNVTPRNSIRELEWAAWRFGYQSNREENKITFCGSEIKGTLLERPYY
jgi:hypothetical protein